MSKVQVTLVIKIIILSGLKFIIGTSGAGTSDKFQSGEN